MNGRPRKEGERFPGGRLKPPSGSALWSGPTLTLTQAEALRRFGKDAERATASTHAEKRLDARQSLLKANAALAPREGAIIDLVVLKGRDLKDLAAQSGQSVDSLDQLLRQAANTLATHYETRTAA